MRKQKQVAKTITKQKAKKFILYWSNFWVLFKSIVTNSKTGDTLKCKNGYKLPPLFFLPEFILFSPLSWLCRSLDKFEAHVSYLPPSKIFSPCVCVRLMWGKERERMTEEVCSDGKWLLETKTRGGRDFFSKKQNSLHKPGKPDNSGNVEVNRREKCWNVRNIWEVCHS